MDEAVAFMGERRLFLASANLGGLPSFFGRTDGATLAFVPTAADPYDDKWFVEADRTYLRDLGFTLREIDLVGETQESLRRSLVGVDGIYVVGGNTFYLLDQVRKSGFDHVIQDLVGPGMPYIGSSAGAVLVGPDVAPIAPFDDPSAAPNLSSTRGLGLVPFVPLPHYGKEKYAARYQEITATYHDRYTLVPFTDDQAIVVMNGSYKLVDSR